MCGMCMLSWCVCVLFLILVSVVIVIVWVINVYLMDWFMEIMCNRVEVWLVLYLGNFLVELRCSVIVFQLLVCDLVLILVLQGDDYFQIIVWLIFFVEEIGVVFLLMLDVDGWIVVVIDCNWLGENFKLMQIYVDVMCSNVIVFIVEFCEVVGYYFVYLWWVEMQNVVLGVIVVEVDLQKFECVWVGILDVVLVIDFEGMILLVIEL